MTSHCGACLVLSMSTGQVTQVDLLCNNVVSSHASVPGEQAGVFIYLSALS